MFLVRRGRNGDLVDAVERGDRLWGAGGSMGMLPPVRRDGGEGKAHGDGFAHAEDCGCAAGAGHSGSRQSCSGGTNCQRSGRQDGHSAALIRAPRRIEPAGPSARAGHPL